MNTRAIARENEHDALVQIASFGWLTTKQIALLVYQQSSEHVAVNKAQLMTKRLESRGFIKARETPAMIKAWILTNAGADRLNAELNERGFDGWARAGYDLETSQYQRHVETVAFLTEKRKQGCAIVGRAGVRAGVVENKYVTCDGIYAFLENDSYIKRGVLVVKNTSKTTIDKIRGLLAQNVELDLIADSRVIKKVRSLV